MEYRDPIGDIIKQSNSLDDLPGKGKPLSKEYQKQDVFQQFQKTARNAGFLPEWLKLQKQVYAALNEVKTADDIEEINKQIRKYNKLCPSVLQKGLVTEDNYEQCKVHWK